MDATEQIRKFSEFIEKTSYAHLLEQIRKGEKFVVLDFQELAKFNIELADMLLEDPEEVLKAAEIAVEQSAVGDSKGFTVRVKSLPKSSQILISDIRSKNLEKFYYVEGIVRNKSPVRPHVTQAKFECPSCGNNINVLQLDKKFKEPTRCSCGRKGKFRLLSKELVDAQGIVLEEAPENLEGGEQPKRLNIFLKKDLVSPLSERKTNPGAKIYISGVLKEVPVILRSGGQSTQFDLLMEANYVEGTEESFSEVKIKDEEIEEIQKLSKDPNLHKILVNSIAPTIYGHERIKEALIVQLFGGVRRKRDDKSVTRGDIHMLLVGDPGAGKSMMLKRVGAVSPKGKFISGKGVSGAGLTASVVKDEFLQGWSLEAGALVLANGGICCIDELDKMSKEDTAAMHEALEGQTITISKANIQATLRAETTVLAAANPKLGRFDPYETIASQIMLPSTLINRFDLIFPIKDLPDKVNDEKLAKFILKLHQSKEAMQSDLDTQFLRKYIAYAKQNIFPVMTDGALDEIKNYYLKIRGMASSDGGAVKSIPISARQLEGMVRMAEANAKIRLSQKVDKRDAKRAIDLLDYCLRLVALDEETGQFDIDRIATDTPATQRNKIILVKEILNDLENKLLTKTIPLSDIVAEASNRGVSENELEEIIQKLKRSGDIFEPKRGFISKI